MTSSFIPAAVAISLLVTACGKTDPPAVQQASLPAEHTTIAPQCSSAEHRQFDFWIGEWEVKYPDGRPAGVNHIESILDGCALHEQWTSARPPYVGESVNTYRAEFKSWHQTWVDNAGGTLLIDGEFGNGVMRMEGVSLDSTGARVFNRITWSKTDSTGNRLRQVWETSRDGRTWQNDFDGIYTRKGGAGT